LKFFSKGKETLEKDRDQEPQEGQEDYGESVSSDTYTETSYEYYAKE